MTDNKTTARMAPVVAAAEAYLDEDLASGRVRLLYHALRSAIDTYRQGKPEQPRQCVGCAHIARCCGAQDANTCDDYQARKEGDDDDMCGDGHKRGPGFECARNDVLPGRNSRRCGHGQEAEEEVTADGAGVEAFQRISAECDRFKAERDEARGEVERLQTELAGRPRYSEKLMCVYCRKEFQFINELNEHSCPDAPHRLKQLLEDEKRSHARTDSDWQSALAERDAAIKRAKRLSEAYAKTSDKLVAAEKRAEKAGAERDGALLVCDRFEESIRRAETTSKVCACPVCQTATPQQPAAVALPDLREMAAALIEWSGDVPNRALGRTEERLRGAITGPVLDALHKLGGNTSWVEPSRAPRSAPNGKTGTADVSQSQPGTASHTGELQRSASTATNGSPSRGGTLDESNARDASETAPLPTDMQQTSPAAVALPKYGPSIADVQRWALATVRACWEAIADLAGTAFCEQVERLATAPPAVIAAAPGGDAEVLREYQRNRPHGAWSRAHITEAEPLKALVRVAMLITEDHDMARVVSLRDAYRNLPDALKRFAE